MCGLIYNKSFKGRAVNHEVMQQYDKQKYRGQEGFGVFDVDHKKMARHPDESHILRWLKTKPSTEIMFHHRFPTSTKNVKNACHPFSTYDYFGDNQYILIHNGVISNPYELQKTHEELGITYSSMQLGLQGIDAEALLWDVALYLEGKQDKLEIEGSIAFICIKQTPEGNKLFFGRNDGSPLIMQFNKKRLALSSTGTGQVVTPDTLYEFNYDTHVLTQEKLIIPKGYGWGSGYSRGSSYTPGSYADEHSRSDNEFDWEDAGYEYDAETLTWHRKSSDPNDPWDGDTYDDDYNNGYEYTGEVGNPIKTLPADPKLSTLATEIKDRVSEFMELANGYYRLAYEMLGERLQELQKTTTLLNIGEAFEREVLIGARSVIWHDPFWTYRGDEVQDEKFISSANGIKMSYKYDLSAPELPLGDNKGILVSKPKLVTTVPVIPRSPTPTPTEAQLMGAAN